MQILYSVGDRTETCGTPAFISLGDDISSETSVQTQWTTRRHIPEDDTLHNHGCENLKSYNRIFLGLSGELFLIIVVIIKQNVGLLTRNGIYIMYIW
jgi:hypothetical protein